MPNKYDNPYKDPCESCSYGGYCECAESGGCCIVRENSEKSDIWRAGYRSGRDEQREFIRENPNMLIKIYGEKPIDVSRLSKPDMDKLGELLTEMLTKIDKRKEI